MNYAEIKNYDIANGPGLRVSLFVSGCTNHCPGCFNKETWDFNYGIPFTDKTIDLILEMLNNKHIAGLSLLGGEPMEESNRKSLLPLVKKVKSMYPNKDIWCYTGFLFEDVREYEILQYIDVLIDGRFVKKLKVANLRFRGSTNQRIINVKESIKSNEIILWE